MTGRKLTDVISAMLVHVPDGEFRVALVDMKSSVEFAPPESEQMWWNEVLRLMLEYAAPSDPDDIEQLLAMEDWKKKVLMEFNPEMKKLFKE